MVRASRIRGGLLALTALAAAGCARLIGGEAGVVLEAVEHGTARTELGRTTPPPLLQRMADADLWLPADRTPAASLVLAPGFSELGRDDPRLIPVAEALARAGFAVRIPVLPGAARLTLDPADIAAMRRAAEAEGAAGRRVALAGISFGAAPALLAGQAPPASLVVTLGGFHSMAAVATFAATGAHRAPGEAAWRRGAPNTLAPGAFLLAIAEAMPGPADRALLRAAAERRLSDPVAPLDELAARMGPDGRAALALVAEREPEAIPDRLAALPAEARGALAALDPSAAALRTCTLAIHGLADPVIPPTQSQALAAALPPGRSVLVLVPGLGHVEPSGVPLPGQLALIRAMRQLLGWRDGTDPCATALAPGESRPNP
jgi:pimeloyl-ACP methyl ester carboxylesterase